MIFEPQIKSLLSCPDKANQKLGIMQAVNCQWSYFDLGQFIAEQINHKELDVYEDEENNCFWIHQDFDFAGHCILLIVKFDLDSQIIQIKFFGSTKESIIYNVNPQLGRNIKAESQIFFEYIGKYLVYRECKALRSQINLQLEIYNYNIFYF